VPLELSLLVPNSFAMPQNVQVWMIQNGEPSIVVIVNFYPKFNGGQSGFAPTCGVLGEPRLVVRSSRVENTHHHHLIGKTIVDAVPARNAPRSLKFVLFIEPGGTDIRRIYA